MIAKETVTEATQVIGLKPKRRITEETIVKIEIKGPKITVGTTRQRKTIILVGKIVLLRINKIQEVVIEINEITRQKTAINRRKTTQEVKVTTGAEGKETRAALKMAALNLLSHGRTALMQTADGAEATNSSSVATRSSNSLITIGTLVQPPSRNQLHSRLVTHSK